MPRRLAPALLTAILLAGCGSSWLGEEREYYMRRELQQLISPGWVHDAGERIGFDEVWPTAKQREAANEKQICMHQNSRERVMQQDGVNDKVGYRRCVLAPYQTDAGSRMGNRPDGVGDVVN